MKKRKAHCRKAAVNLVTRAKISTRKSARICSELSDSGVAIPTPSQSGIYKAVMKKAEEVDNKYLYSLKDREWCLHFDGKKINGKEYQVIVLKNECEEKRLAVLELSDGKAKTIFQGIKNVLDKYKLWETIKMIICDTTNVNTGLKGGIVTFP